MNRNSIPLGKILGIPIGLDYSWFLIFALLTWMLGGSYYPAEFKDWSAMLCWIVGGLTAVLFFGSVLLHELGHSVVALWYKIPVRSITLFLFGGVAVIGDDPPSASAEFFIAIAGPLVSLALGLFFYALELMTKANEPIFGLAKYLAYINLALAVFNMIPGYPLDGGRVFRAVVWAMTGKMQRATVIAVMVGRFFAFLFIIFGVLKMLEGNFGGGLWIAFIGWYLDNAAAAQLHQVAFHDMLAGHSVSQAMDTHCIRVPADMTLQDMVDEHILGGGQRCFLVYRGDQAVGLMTVHRMKETPRQEWASTAVAQVMLPIQEMKRLAPDTELWSALQFMDRGGVNQLPVLKGNQVIGMLSRQDVISFLGAIRELRA